ncbi:MULTISPECIES: hypothetical protein [unclassified Nocardioides]|uniref:hypothetical protein n=1 Tax=unclassified Nocardioides TaxID=2615069 RepID=UPI0007021A15|nr:MULTISPECIES: hypothetical protein [unclassified Nocardioides]KQY54565.1 hypothetical protein ASD30_18135 [Nocardioides sp. Root140]KQZ66440.1 hypothetical protein ASD66_23220 [Nocardioides sp. Root151]KRF19640.1 hypothetical protein ASH02_24095 [Nocardioides sp. Soil796]
MLVVVVGLVAVSVLLVCVAAFLRRTSEATPEPHRLWAVASANTTDGVTARTGVEFVVHLPGAVADAGTLSDAVEDLLRRGIAASPAHALPSIGDDPAGLSGATVAGVAIESAVVTSSEVEVTPELRRLMLDRTTPHGTG